MRDNINTDQNITDKPETKEQDTQPVSEASDGHKEDAKIVDASLTPQKTDKKISPIRHVKHGVFKTIHWPHHIYNKQLDKHHNDTQTHHHHPLVWMVSITLGILLITAVAASLFYKPQAKTTLSQVRIAGVSMTNINKSTALKKLNAVSANQKITIGIDGQYYTFSSKELGINRDVTDAVDSTFAGPQSRIEQIFIKQQQDVGVKTYVNKNKLTAAIESKLGQQYEKPQNASLSTDGASITAHASKVGLAINFDSVLWQLKISNIYEDIKINANLVKTEPKISTAAAEAAKNQAEYLVSKTYAVDSKTSGIKYVSKAQKVSWLRFTDNDTTNTINVAINADAAKTTLTQIANSFTRGVKDRVVLNLNNAPAMVIDSGQDGIGLDVNSLNAGLEQLKIAVANQHDYTISINLTSQPKTDLNIGGAYGGRFILVDINNFRAHAIENSSIARTMLISTGMASMPTPRGYFKILSKRPLQTMTGCSSGVGCWSVPNVPNVEYFTSAGHAFHGTYWHNMFGQANLSHGCVNLTLSDAQWLYSWTVVGTDVIVI